MFAFYFYVDFTEMILWSEDVPSKEKLTSQFLALFIQFFFSSYNIADWRTDELIPYLRALAQSVM